MKKAKITKDMKIEEIIRINPLAAEVLAEEGFHCFGCGGASIETVEQGLLAHGKTKKQIDEILKKLNK
ncbi:TPA: DUF1858 domain-containing protein [Candidatus Woesearchaeota archaeon]|nr:DUF1858 domain-containing protein [Candidatus Woesearchaeota archaeon]HIH39353.1 DUF1858 domain-containing protein [Candidatus Woesearchaeota archaeon]